ncbi:tagatose bisphosphate family class II aldolase [Clostridium sediminicola]|uniref:class II fructose-bisphosphate aldolase n=1 Tax=Clostridium sediminicola TaxID=3114879 RepID=UPI0031F246CD
MNLVRMKELLQYAEKSKKGIAAINVSNMETIKAVMEAASIANFPVILQVAPIQLEIQKITYEEIAEIVKILGKKYDIKASLHLDHAETVEECKEAIDAGFTSVMYDGSKVSLEENMKNSKEVVLYAKPKEITVEAELGRVAGAEGESNDSIKALMTDPSIAAHFVKSTGIDCLAVSIGNAHGEYKFEPKLDFERLKAIYNEAKIPLVLHGGTGIPDKDIKKAIELGIRKINFYTEIDSEFVKGFIEAYTNNNKIYMMSAQEEARQRMIKKTVNKIELCKRIKS